MPRGRPSLWSTEELAHACDVVVQGLQDRTPFDGNPRFIEAMQTCAKLLRGDSDNVRSIGLSSRSDETYLLIKVKENSPNEQPHQR